MPFAPLFVIYGLVLLATPVLTIALYVRYAKLRKQLNELAEENTKQHTKLQRAVGELQSKLAATPHPAAPAVDKTVASESRQPTPVPVPRSFPTLQIPAPVVVPPRVDVQAPTKPQTTPPVSPAVPPQKPTVPPAPVEPIPLAPAKPAPPPAARPTPPAAPPKVVPPPAAPHTPAIPPAAAARVSTPPPISPLRVSAPPPSFQQKKISISSIQETLGASWFAILGVIMTVIGLALLGKLALQNLGPAGKSLILYAVSLAFLGGGIFLEKRDRYQTLGRVAIGGGWALLFFSTFGIHYVPAMRVLDSGVLDSALMLAVAVGMAAHTLRYKSQFVTGIAFLLGY